LGVWIFGMGLGDFPNDTGFGCPGGQTTGLKKKQGGSKGGG